MLHAARYRDQLADVTIRFFDRSEFSSMAISTDWYDRVGFVNLAVPVDESMIPLDVLSHMADLALFHVGVSGELFTKFCRDEAHRF